MNDWQQDFQKTFDSIAQGVEQFFQEISHDMNQAADALLEWSDEMADEAERTLVQLDEAMAPTLDQLDEQLNHWFDPILQVLIGFESTFDETIAPVTRTVEPILNQHPVCVGCRHYHGQIYGGEMLVCAMHPYGVMEGADSCPDKELVSWGLPDLRSDEDSDGDF